MRCRKTRSYLSAYCNDELGGRRKLAVSEHLSTCQECRREEELYRSMFGAAGEIPELKVSEDFNNKVLNRIAHERFAETRTRAYLPKSPPVFAWTKVVPALAAACLVVVVTMMTFGPQDDPGSPGFADGSARVDDSYLTVQPVHNPNMAAKLNKNWSFDGQMAQAERINRISSSLSGNGTFGAYGSTTGLTRVSSASAEPVPFVKNYYRIRPVIRVYIQAGSSSSGEVNKGY
jgi:hypothetical protein